MSNMWTIGSILTWTTQYFSGKGIDSARLDAEILLSHVLQKERIYLYAHYDEPLNGPELAAYRELVKKRASRLSVAHILGQRSFMGFDFTINRHVLVPRPETEMLVETVMEDVPTDGTASFLDLGTGSGAIVLSLLALRPHCTGTGVDISADALAVARENGEKLGLTERVTWLESDLFAAVPPASYDWILSNPPYLTKEDMQHLEPEVRYDPPQALFGGDDGLELYRRIAAGAAAYLKENGCCAVEAGAGQSQAIARIFTETGAFTLKKIVKDYGGIERVVVCQRKEC
ncbi:peptide chain release factor N(5)-glutamine methyltransferase [Megasphaera hominis]|jgi:release factor glutamine methyltransferase|uniref:Release factor glutamine methyltransferase n=1 Tax=Megasphaera hominis TaxID=159836 RepID=A0ABR6VI24_9FIRM|nr:peptide chain release factor N(5)-glutamine methyltransferase [Megasphaera hominis]MBC3536952.1 peptide chain release factor N(5)-glutamine methyltransferase [Megasphaera hominis]